MTANELINAKLLNVQNEVGGIYFWAKDEDEEESSQQENSSRKYRSTHIDITSQKRLDEYNHHQNNTGAVDQSSDRF